MRHFPLPAQVLLGVLLIGASACSGRSAVSDARAETMRSDTLTAILNVHVVPMTLDTVLPHRAVLVTNGTITGIVPMESFSVPAGAAVIDGEGRHLLPGLVDAHVHLRATSELESYLRHGVTTIVNMRGTAEHVALRERLRRGELPGPRLYTTGPLIDGDPPIWDGDGTRVLTSVSEVDAVVAAHDSAGYDLVKVYNNLDPLVLEALVRAARERGLAVVGHLPRRPVRSEGLRRALDAGIAMIAHGEEIFFTHFGGAPDSLIARGRYEPPTDSAIRHVAREIARSGAAFTPNLSFIAMTARMLEDVDAVFADPEFARLDAGVREMWLEQNPTRRPALDAFRARERAKYAVVRRLTRALNDEGVLMLTGTDASAPGLYPGKSLHVELRELVEAGLTPYEALATATRNPGRFLAQRVDGAAASGTITPGMAADLLLVDGNPLESLAVLERPELVMVGGRVVFEGA